MGLPRDKHSGLSHSELQRLLRYEPETGKFFWRQKINHAGGEAGWVNPETGYRIIKVGGVKVMAHRLAWFYVRGTWPNHRIDHKNGVRDDQRIDNLREASDRQNKANEKVRKDNRLGVKGVSRSQNGWYDARIWDGKKNIHLGRYPKLEEAKAAYDAAARRMFGEFARAA